MYQKNNYKPNHIWNSNEIRIQVGKQVKTKIPARRRSHIIYNIILKSYKWLIVNYVMNVKGTILPRFYIFQGERMCDDYIK